MPIEDTEDTLGYIGDIANKIGVSEYSGSDAKFIARGDSLVFRVGDRALKIFPFDEPEEVFNYVKLTHLAKVELDGKKVTLGSIEYTLFVNPVDNHFQRSSDGKVCTVSKFIEGPNLNEVIFGDAPGSSFNNLLSGTDLHPDDIRRQLQKLSEETNQRLHLPRIGGVWISTSYIKPVKGEEGDNQLIITDVSNTVNLTPKLL